MVKRGLEESMATSANDRDKPHQPYIVASDDVSPSVERVTVSRPSLKDVPNGWEQGVTMDNPTPPNLRGNVCSGNTKPKSLERFPEG